MNRPELKNLKTGVIRFKPTFFGLAVLLSLFLWLSNSSRTDAEADHSLLQQKLDYACNLLYEQKYDMAIDAVKEIAPAAESKTEKFLCNYYLAKAYKERGDFREALSPVMKALNYMRNDPQANLLAGEIYDGLGDSTQAQNFYVRAGSSRSSIAAIARSRVASDANSKVVDYGCWPQNRMPLRVYIDDGVGTEGYSPDLKQAVVDALEKWKLASGKHFSYRILPPNSKFERKDARQSMGNTQDAGRDIHVHWLPMLRLPGVEPLGATYPKTLQCNDINFLICSDVYVATNETVEAKTYTFPGASLYDSEQAAHERQLRYIILHEIGHALGLGHSTLRSDVMSPIVFGGLSLDVASDASLTASDIRHFKGLFDREWPKQAVVLPGKSGDSGTVSQTAIQASPKQK